MQLRQQRRRRVWPDEVTGDGVDGDDPARQAGADASGGQLRETYTSQARRDEQPRLTDLVPTRYRVLALWYAGGLATIGLLEFLHARLAWLADQVAPAVPRVFNLAERGSFAAWCSSAWLSIAALTSVLLFSLRRHRIDDYRGRYRIWIWAALGWMALAVNQTAPWDELVRELTMRMGARVGLNQDWVWPLLCVTAAVAVAVRLTIEMRGSRLSLALLWTGGLTWTAALVCARLDLAVDQQTMLVAGLTLAGQWTLLAAQVAYARHVLLDAHGLLTPRLTAPRPRLARRTRKSAAAAGADEPASTERQAAANAKTTPAPAAKPAAAAAAPTKVAAPAKVQAQPPARLGVLAEESDEDDDSDRQLSRAERKRLKRQQRDSYREAA
jgi:hypothetical protein